MISQVIHISFYILCITTTLYASIITVPSREIIPPTVNSSSKENRTTDLDGAYKSTSEDPCGSSMTFVKSDEDPNVGTCKCKYGAMTSICKAKPVAFWKPTNSCYPLYERGPCDTNEWLILNDDDQLECQKADCIVKNTALNETPSPSFSFVYNGTCYETLSQAYCEKEEIVVFLGSLNKPTCVPQSSKLERCYPESISFFALSTQVALPCQDGSRRAPDGTCSPSADF